MKCPYCGDQESKVVDSRHSDDGLSIRRRRECLSCQKRFTLGPGHCDLWQLLCFCGRSKGYRVF